MTVNPAGAAATAVRTTSERSAAVSVWYSQRPVGAHAVAPLGREPGDVLGETVDVDVKFAVRALAGAQRQRSGDQDAVPR